MSGAIVLRMKRSNPWNLLIALLLISLFVYLTARAHNEYRWSDWEFGDAQTMLSLRHWQEGGWAKNYFLFKPQGYAAAVDLLDGPELRHHAHGISPKSSPQVGPRLLYTHYPAGYLIPYAALFKVGIDSIFSMRILSIIFSLGALALMYTLFATITKPKVAFVAVLFYALSVSFLGYADSLANQPIDDLLRFGFMLAVVYASRAGNAKWRRYWAIIAWIIEFLLSMSSFDSVFYLYIWLIGWDLLEKRGFRWKTYLVFALAPFLAHSLQLLQNVWYLGWADAVQDIMGTFFMKNGTYNNGGGRVEGIALALISVLYMVYSPGLAIMAIFGMYLAGLKWFLVDTGKALPSGMLLLVLFLCGLGFIVVLPMAARIASYEGRQMVPFVALLVSGYTWLALDGCRLLLSGGGLAGNRQLLPGGRGKRAGYLAVAMVALLLFWGGFIFSNRFQSSGPENMNDILLAQDLKNIPTQYEPVYFEVGAFEKFLDPEYVPGYPQIQPETEYYAGSRPILCFNNPALLAQDIITMARKSHERRFSPVVITDSLATMEQVLSGLDQQGILTGMPKGSDFRMDKFVLDLTPFLNWGQP